MLRIVTSALLLLLIVCIAVASPASAAQQNAGPVTAKLAAASPEELTSMLTGLLSTGDDRKDFLRKIDTLDNASKSQLIPALLNELGNDDHNYQAVLALGRIGPLALPGLLKILQDPGDSRRQHAVLALGKMGPKAASADSLLIKAAKEPDVHMHETVVTALGQIGPVTQLNAEITPILIAALKDNVPDCESAVGSFGAPAVPAVRLVFKNSTDVKLRHRALVALYQMGPKAAPAVPDLIPAIKDPEFRADAVLALGAIGPAAKDAVPSLISVMQCKPGYWDVPPPSRYSEDKVRENATYALALIGPPAVVTPVLIDAYKKDTPGSINALERLGAPAVPPLLEMLKDPAASVGKQNGILNIFIGMGPQAAAAVPDIIPMIDDDAHLANASLALGAMGPAAKDAVPALIAILHKDYGSKGMDAIHGMTSKECAAEGLEGIGTPEALAAAKEYRASIADK